MASALFTLADGSGSAVAVGGTSQPVGLNVTSGNTVNGQITDMTGVTGYSARTIYNNLGLSDFTFSQANFTINQATGAWSFPAGSVEGAAYVVEVQILTSTLVPTVQRAFVGVYVSAQGSYRVLFPSTATTPQALVALLAAPQNLPQGDPNLGIITNVSTTNAQGQGGPTIVALVQLVVKASGVFDYAVSGLAAAAAADVSTWTVTTQTGTGAITYTGNTASGVGGQLATGAAGTGIAITAGGGGALTQDARALTIATAAAGDRFDASGIVHNSVTATAITPFARGNNVFLILNYTNSVANRAVSNLKLKFAERLFG